MKLIHILKIITFFIIVFGFSIKTKAQQLASQKPLSSFYSKKAQENLAVKKANNQQISQLQKQNLTSTKPLPKKVMESKMKNPTIARNASLPNNEKIKKLPSKSALTVNQIAARKPASQKPRLR